MKHEEVVDIIGNRFAAALVSARRARQIQSYYANLGTGVGGSIPPQVSMMSSNPLSIAMEEIAQGKVEARIAEASDIDEDTDPGETPIGVRGAGAKTQSPRSQHRANGAVETLLANPETTFG